MSRNSSPLLVSLATSLLIAGCPSESVRDPVGPEMGRSPTARTEIVEALRRDQEAARHPSDGGGSVRFANDPEPVMAGGLGSWSFIYRAGPLGIAENAWLFFQAPPFWGWSSPQVIAPEVPGYTEVTTEAEGLSLSADTVDQQLLAIQIKGRALREGEEIRVIFGARGAGAVADRYSEARSCFYFAVDGDGDGIRALVEEPLCTEVAAGPAVQLVVTLPSTARPGEPVDLTVAVLDAVGNRASDWTGSAELEAPSSVEVPTRVLFESRHEGARRVGIETRAGGTVRIAASTADGLRGVSNPMKIGPTTPRVLWGDLHGHTALTDGTGTPKDYFRYARDVAGLDVIALTDHDHWGMQPLAVHPELWEEIRRETELLNRPGQFITLLGFEWTSWIHGHRHVLYFSDQGEILSSVNGDYESPLQLWDALRGSDALTFAHHSAGGPIATNWLIPPDPELEPITEIVSVHGSSESLDSPSVIYSPVAGNFVRDVLDRGFVFGLIGSGDSHDGHPGLAHLNAPSGGLAAILTEDRTREGVREAMVARRVYATNGPRILLEVDLANRMMGALIAVQELNALEPADRYLRVGATGTDGIDRIELIRSGEVVERFECGSEPVCDAEFPMLDARSGEYLYTRVVQLDGGTAWSSPFYFR